MSLFERSEKLRSEAKSQKTEVTEVTEVTSPKSLIKSEVTNNLPEVTEVTSPKSLQKADHEKLTATDQTDLEVDHLDAALFLFAINTVRQTPAEQFMDMGRKFVPYWRDRGRLPPEAWQIVKEEIKIRLEEINQNGGSNA